MRTKAVGGVAMVELLIASLLLALAVSVMISSMLSSSGQGGRLQRKESASLQSNQLLQSLKNYVAADVSAATRPFAPNCCWNICDPPGACTCGPPPAGPCPAGWALSNGWHDVSFLLPAELARYGGSLRYEVTTVNGQPQARVEVQWNEP